MAVVVEVVVALIVLHRLNRRYCGGNGGDGAGILGIARTQGGSQALITDNWLLESNRTGGKVVIMVEMVMDKVSAGGKGGKAIISNGIEIAVSGTILGEVV